MFKHNIDKISYNNVNIGLMQKDTDLSDEKQIQSIYISIFGKKNEYMLNYLIVRYEEVHDAKQVVVNCYIDDISYWSLFELVTLINNE